MGVSPKGDRFLSTLWKTVKPAPLARGKVHIDKVSHWFHVSDTGFSQSPF